MYYHTYYNVSEKFITDVKEKERGRRKLFTKEVVEGRDTQDVVGGDY